jgi:outer membrane lipoprotein LolB
VRRLILLFLVAGLAACESTPVRTVDGEDWLRHQQQVAAQERWLMQGRVAIRYAEDGGQGLLHWRQQDESYDLRFYDALNRLQLHIEGNGSGVKLHARNGDVREASSAESLMQDYLGWSVPVDALRYWVRGLPEPSMEILESQMSNSRLIQLGQGDWQIQYQRYEEVEGVWLPDLLKINAPDLRIKLVVEKWSLS